METTTVSQQNTKNIYDIPTVINDTVHSFDGITWQDQRLHMGIEHGQRVHFSLNDGREGWATVVDLYRNSEDSAYKVLLSDKESTIWITADSINSLGGFDKSVDVTQYLSNVLGLPIVAQTYVNFWYNTPVWVDGEVEATAIDIEGKSVICWVDGWHKFSRFNLDDLETDEIALESEWRSEYEEWLDDLEQVYTVA